MLDIRYRIDRMKALHALAESGLTETQAQRLDELHQARDEDGMLALLEGATLSPPAHKKLDILRQAKLLGERLTQLSRSSAPPRADPGALPADSRDQGCLRAVNHRGRASDDQGLTRLHQTE